MKRMKMFGLAMFVVLAFAAIAGAGSASAVELCKEVVNPCPVGQRYPSGTLIEGTNSGDVIIQTTGGVTNQKVTCKKSTLKGNTINTMGIPLFAEVKSLTFGECSENITGGACTAAGVETPWGATITTDTAGTVDGKGLMAIEKPDLTMNCAAIPAHCVYGSAAASTTIDGGNPALLTIDVVLNKTSGTGNCPPDATWKGTYSLLPKPLFVI